MWWLWLGGAAPAEVPFPSWRDETVHQIWTEVDAEVSSACTKPRFIGQAATCDEAKLRAAMTRAATFEAVVCPDGGLEFEIGLAHRYLGENGEAEAHYRRATELSPDDYGAWNELGEILLVQGRWDEAKPAFQRVSDLLEEDAQGWRGPWRLAEIAANQHDPAEFEIQIREALHRGFSFQTIAGLPNWQRFYADPALHDSIAKLITVYGDPRVLQSLQTP